jgi:two-component sensor histidine kinase
VNTKFRKLLRYSRIAFVLFLLWTTVGLAYAAFGVIAVTAENRADKPIMIFVDSLFRAWVWGILSPLVFLFAKWMKIDPRKLKFKAIAGNLIFGIALTFFYPWIFVAIARASNSGYFDTFPTVWSFLSRQVVVFGWYTLISLYIPTFLTIQTWLFLKNYRDEQAKNATLQAELSRAQLTALKMQLHPHFLFNSLHSISSLILLDPKRANTMVALLGDFLRQTLEHSNDQMVTLADELEFLRCYLDIEKTRFDDRLSVNFDIEQAALDAEVPHLIVQPLVENAIKHGISPYESPGRVEISAEKNDGTLSLSVRNTGGHARPAPGPPKKKENGFGLANVETRLKNIYGDDARLTVADLKDGGFLANLSMPFSVHGPALEDRREKEDDAR